MPDRPEVDLRLIVVTDRELAGTFSIQDRVRRCLEGGARAVQLRDKSASSRDLYDEALVLRALTAEFGARFFVNDRLDVALATGADGVHLGPSDLPLAAARSIARPPFLIGFSCDTPEAARHAEAAGADYIGCGAVFGTGTKAGLEGERIGTEGLAAVVRAVRIPVIGIGGVTPDNAGRLGHAGAAGAAVVHALMAAEQPATTASRILTALSQASSDGIPE